MNPIGATKRSARKGQLRARVPAELEAQVEAIAVARGADKSDVIREAVMRFVESPNDRRLPSGQVPAIRGAEVAS